VLALVWVCMGVGPCGEGSVWCMFGCGCGWMRACVHGV